MRIPLAEIQTVKPQIELYLPQDNFKFNDNIKQRNTCESMLRLRCGYANTLRSLHRIVLFELFNTWFVKLAVRVGD